MSPAHDTQRGCHCILHPQFHRYAVCWRKCRDSCCSGVSAPGSGVGCLSLLPHVTSCIMFVPENLASELQCQVPTAAGSPAQVCRLCSLRIILISRTGSLRHHGPTTRTEVSLVSSEAGHSTVNRYDSLQHALLLAESMAEPDAGAITACKGLRQASL